MANTLAQLNTLATDAMVKGILDTIIKESPLMRSLPWKTINSNNLLYNLEQTMVGGNWVTPGDIITESTPTWAQRSAKLFELIGDADVDLFVAQTRGEQDIEAAIIEKKVKGMVYDFEKAFLYGGTTTSGLYTSSKCMTGLMLMLAQSESVAGTTVDWDGLNNPQLIPAGAASAILTIDMMNQLRDAIMPGAVSAYILSRRMRRKLDSLARASGNMLYDGVNALGYPCTMWGGTELIIDDYIYDNIQDGTSSVVTLTNYDPATARAAGYDNSAIFAVQFGEDGLCGLKNGDLPDVSDRWDKLETKNASRQRVKMYVGAADFMPTKIAALFNVQDVAL